MTGQPRLLSGLGKTFLRGSIFQSGKHTVEDGKRSLICSSNYLEVVTHLESLEDLSIVRNDEEFLPKKECLLFARKHVEFQDNR